MLLGLVPLLIRDGEISLSHDHGELLMGMSAATIDRRLKSERERLMPRGRSHTKPGSLLKSQIPIRTWAEWTGLSCTRTTSRSCPFYSAQRPCRVLPTSVLEG